jgi:DNA-binding CsgD family transcriptional regulator/tetratricopeptide (TPR) repeat protein
MGVDLETTSRTTSGPGPDAGPLTFASSRPRAILAEMATATTPTFIGRADEFARLLTVLERAEEEHPTTALVAGDAGVGKTRLLTELAARAEQRGFRVLLGGCMEVGDLGLPYVPFVDAFRDLGTRPGEAELAAPLVGALPGLGRLLPWMGEDTAPPPASRDGFEQVQLLDGVVSLLVRLSEPAPLLLVIEDLHWADRSTRDLLSYLVRTLRSGRIALVASYRSDELHRRHPLRPLLAELVRMPDLERIELPPFDRDQLDQYLEALVGEKVSGDAVDRILRRSEGNAFFAEELVAAGAVRADVQLPEALADVLLRRVEALPELAREVLKVAAVAGRQVGHQLLVAATGRPEAEVEEGLREAIAAQLLVMDPASESYRFRHALLQEVVYGDLLPGERSRLHATYARLLADRGPAAELAHHCLAAHDLPGALAALVRAAADATAVFAPAEAMHHLDHAIELWERVPDAAAVAGLDRVALLLLAAEAASNSGEFRHAVSLAREAVAEVEGSPDRPRVASALERLGYYLLAFPDMDEVMAICRRAAELVDVDPPTALRARIGGWMARALLNARRYDEARRWCDQSLQVARAAEATNEETHALITLAALEDRLDNTEVGLPLLREARAKATAASDHLLELRAQYMLGVIQLDRGDLAAGAAAFEEAVAVAEAAGLTWSGYGIQAGVLRSYAYYQAGRWDEAEHVACGLDERSPAASSLSAAALFVEVGRGRPGARARLANIQEAHSDNEWANYMALGCGADLALWQGELDEARALARACLVTLEDTDEQWELSAIWPATIGLAAEADRAARARLDGDDEALAEATKVGRDLLERSRTAERQARLTGRQVGPEAIAWLARAEAEWARLEGNAEPELWAASAEAFGYGCVYEEARSRWRLVEALLAVGRREEAAEQARAAHATALRLGAEPLRNRVEALARRGRLDLGPGVPLHEGLAALEAHLTPRELEVLRLVTAGRSNQQIGDALYISRKTASVHVSNILAKLGVRSRVEAAATAHRLGLDAPPDGQ